MQEVCQTISPGMMDTYYKFPEILFGDDTAIVQHRAILEQVFFIFSTCCLADLYFKPRGFESIVKRDFSFRQPYPRIGEFSTIW